MTKNTVLKRSFTALMAFLMLIMAMCGFMATKASAETEEEIWVVKRISDQYATAEIYSDGSGTVIFNDAFASLETLTEIDGVPLSDIIKFDGGGCVKKIYNIVDACDPIYDYSICVYGSGPTGFFHAGILKFMDKTGDTYELSIWNPLLDNHHVMYNSDNPTLAELYWYTD